MRPHELRRAVEELSRLRSDGEPIVSLYLDTRWSDEKRRERARLFVREAVRRALDRHDAHPQRDALERTLARVAQAAADRAAAPSEGTAGLAVFACEALGLWRQLELARSLADELCVDGRPHLLQLARLQGDVEPALVVLVHDRGLRVYEVALGAVVDEAVFERAVPRRLGKGGRVHGGANPGASAFSYFERERKNERHVEEVVQRTRREAVEGLTRLFDREPRQRLVLVGTAEQVADLARLLPERVAAAVVARLPQVPAQEQRPGSARDELVRRTTEAVLAHERALEGEDVERAVAEALRGGLAVVGSEDVVLAVNERRVLRLILEEDFESSGWRCRDCGALGTTHDEVCSFCQGALARVESLGEELVGRVLGEGGEVEVVAHAERLHRYGRVAAVLRQVRANGLSGRSPAPG